MKTTEKLTVDLSVLERDEWWWRQLSEEDAEKLRKKKRESIPFFMARSQEAINKKSGGAFMICVGDEVRARHLFNNMLLLRQHGMYEEALYDT